MISGLALAAMVSSAAHAASPFIEALRKAEARSASDPERVEFAGRALRAWMPSDGRLLRAHVHFIRAEGESALFDDPAAEEDLTKALEIDGNNDRAKLMRAAARAALGRGAEAERDALDYLAVKGDDAEGWLTLGDARLAQGAPKADRAAREAFAKAASLLGGPDHASIGDGRSQLAMRRPKEALIALSAAAERPQKRRAEILNLRARAYGALGDWNAARADLSTALPDLERAIDERRRTGAVKRAHDAALKSLADAYFRRGLANEALRAEEAAVADHRQACALGLPPACARVDALTAKAAPPAPPKLKKAPRRKNTKGDSGDRVYAN